MELISTITDPELGGCSFSVIRETWRQTYGKTVLVSEECFDNISGNIQPATSEDIKLFPQEERSEEIIQILAPFAFSSGVRDPEEASFTVSDKIEYRGATYKLIKTKNWSHPGGFHKAWAIRQREKGADSP